MAGDEGICWVDVEIAELRLLLDDNDEPKKDGFHRELEDGIEGCWYVFGGVEAYGEPVPLLDAEINDEDCRCWFFCI